ncbi:CpaF family protein [Pseudidiomarina andamanensis]|uniref:CpaF family protein n=2 Tax=Pseudidiomarina andamanensis TaxID=1940690 RepID=A0AA92EU98_9GAMM|nr:CpaF family protein [Pseudidiomarina andamanensis]
MSSNELQQHAIVILENYKTGLSADDASQLSLVIEDIVNDCIGFGPLTGLLHDGAISEIMVNDFQTIYVEKEGQLSLSSVAFSSEEELLLVIDRIITPLGRRLDSSQPMVDARMPDGSRVNAVLSPIALRGSCLTVRKFLAKQLQFDDLISQGSLSTEAALYLQESVVQRRNILIAGGTGTGKTTLLNTLASEIPEHQRVITIEDAAELQLSHRNLIALESRPPNAEGQGRITIRDLLINALRMRPDRIIVGECRGIEAIDMLQAMNTGHEGSLTTLHANSARDALQRLEVMVLMAGLDIPLTAIRQQIASAIDIIVQIQRTSEGARIINEISEVSGIDADVLQMNQMFIRKNNQCMATGVLSEWTL